MYPFSADKVASLKASVDCVGSPIKSQLFKDCAHALPFWTCFWIRSLYSLLGYLRIGAWQSGHSLRSLKHLALMLVVPSSPDDDSGVERQWQMSLPQHASLMFSVPRHVNLGMPLLQMGQSDPSPPMERSSSDSISALLCFVFRMEHLRQQSEKLLQQRWPWFGHCSRFESESDGAPYRVIRSAGWHLASMRRHINIK